MFLNVSKSKNDTITEKYRGEEKKIYQNLREYIEEREEKAFISEEEFLSNTFLQNKYRREYASVMEYLDNLKLTSGQEAMGITKESLLHEAVLDYTTVAGAIKMTGDKEQERRFKEDYDLNRFIRLEGSERLRVYKTYQKESREELYQRENSARQSINQQELDDKLINMMLRTEKEYKSLEKDGDLEAMFNSIENKTDIKDNGTKISKNKR